MVRPPPRSTPFPYTALFRSLVIGGWSQLRVTGSKHILQLRRTGDPRTETVRLALIWREQNLDPGRIFFRASSGIQNSANLSQLFGAKRAFLQQQSGKETEAAWRWVAALEIAECKHVVVDRA